MGKSIIIGLMLILIGMVTAAHFYKLDQVPYGYHIDEYATAVSMNCLSSQGTGPWGQKKPFFVQMGYGQPKPPTYNVIAVPWGKVFGFKPEVFRVLTVIVMSIGVFGIFCLGRRLGGTMVGLWAAVAAVISPWVWVTGRLAYESLFAPVCWVWAIFFLYRKRSIWDFIASGLLLSASMYYYPVARFYVPIMGVVLFGLMTVWKVDIKKRVVWILSLVIPTIPVVLGTLNGDLQSRFNQISIFSNISISDNGLFAGIGAVLSAFFHNYFLHLTPDFLFFKSGPTLVHSSGHFGIFSWLDMLAILLLLTSFWFSKGLFKEYRQFILLSIFGFFLAIVPSALTNIEIPNALRTAMGWPLWCVMVGIVLTHTCKRWFLLHVISLIIAVAFSAAFLTNYFQRYPEESKGMFTFWVREQASQLKTDEDWLKFMVYNHSLDYQIRYYLMTQKGQSCSESFTTWRQVGELMKRMSQGGGG